MTQIINPEREFEKTPALFSDESHVMGIEKDDFYEGIILDSLEEVGNALIVYNGGQVQGARATQDNLIGEIGGMGGGLGAALLTLRGAQNASGLVKRLVEETISSLNSKGIFKKHFDYDGMGTNFFKTSVEAERVGDKYLLELYASYVGSAPEEKLAETLEKPRALLNSKVYGILSIVDDWWFNVNPVTLLKDLPVSKKELEKLAKNISSGVYDGEKPELSFEHNGQQFFLDVGIDCASYLRPENGKYGTEYLQSRGNNIVGGAWTVYDETGNNKISPKPKNPKLSCSIYLPTKYRKIVSRTPAITKEQKESLQNARDYIAEALYSK